MLNPETTEELLDIHENSELSPEKMASSMVLTVFPYDKSKISEEVSDFYNKLRSHLENLGVKFIPHKESLVDLGLKRKLKVILFATYNTLALLAKEIFGIKPTSESLTLSTLRHMRFGKKIRKGVSVIALGEHETGNLPMDNTMSFRETSVISIVDRPKHISRESNFLEHFDTAMNLFTHHMTNIVIAVDKSEWILYNFNASHPTYRIDSPNFDKYLLRGLIPKISAPIMPPRLSEFKMVGIFDSSTSDHKTFVEDLVESGRLLQESGLYPPGKSLEAMPFRNRFYRWIGALHLDHRNGMSYGFLARQLPSSLSPVYSAEETKERFGVELDTLKKNIFEVKKAKFLRLEILGKWYCLQIPSVWVLTQRSGANKTSMDPRRDIIKMGLENCRLVMQTPADKSVINKAYKPSFDTRVILGHALGNAIVASVLQKFQPSATFARKFENSGLAIAHWHGYLNPKYTPRGWYIHGSENAHVSCSSPQSALYALMGKMQVFERALKEGAEYLGDIHIEPHHGSNINYWSLGELGKFFSQSSEVSALGNIYLDHYVKE
jgi:hypothetical protein